MTFFQIDVDFKLRYPSKEDMDVALIKSFAILHNKIVPHLDKIKNVRATIKDAMSNNFGNSKFCYSNSKYNLQN